jgi:hypothetical protein
MKRFHAHLSVTNLTESIGFYSALFGVEPNVTKPDYAKWMLEDPRINFAISERGTQAGLDHFGIQVESDDELEALNQQFTQAALPVEAQKAAACCYSESNKYWTMDPQGVAWETFHSLASIALFGDDTPVPVKKAEPACCPSSAGSSCS